MKRLVLAIIVLLMLVAFVGAGCAEKETQPAPEVASSCVTCHTDKDILKEVAAPEPGEATSAATVGEG